MARHGARREVRTTRVGGPWPGPTRREFFYRSRHVARSRAQKSRVLSADVLSSPVGTGEQRAPERPTLEKGLDFALRLFGALMWTCTTTCAGAMVPFLVASWTVARRRGISPSGSSLPTTVESVASSSLDKGDTLGMTLSPCGCVPAPERESFLRRAKGEPLLPSFEGPQACKDDVTLAPPRRMQTPHPRRPPPGRRHARLSPCWGWWISAALPERYAR
jgi:hypothetical protein